MEHNEYFKCIVIVERVPIEISCKMHQNRKIKFGVQQTVTDRGTAFDRGVLERGLTVYLIGPYLAVLNCRRP